MYISREFSQNVDLQKIKIQFLGTDRQIRLQLLFGFETTHWNLQESLSTTEQFRFYY